MTTRKPKLNLLYVSAATETPWLQLAVVTPDAGMDAKHARQWQAARSVAAPVSRELPPPRARTVH
jgi:hypothetical protein